MTVTATPTETTTEPTTDVAATTDRMAMLETKIDLLTERITVLTDDAEQRARQRAIVDEFTADASRISGDALDLVTERLAEAERRGYFSVARAGARVADRVVTSLDEDDLDQLGDNVVAILDTVREITQPELLTLLGRMVGAVRAEQEHVQEEHGDAPGFWALAKELRDPDVRRGMARALHTLRAVSVQTGPTDTTAHPTSSEGADS
ncbi:MAG: DUF1641 domain-containing protein [Ilumatobacter sp.]|nr:DUF1641 domain-containing protein [Ilumatobacter sp.]